MPDSAMIFAAGFGTRMGDLTKHQPKPLIKVNGRALIDHSLDLLEDSPISHIVVNLHYHAPLLETHLNGIKNLQTITEHPEILETGGGLKNALSLLGSKPVVAMNSDAIWTGDNPIKTVLNHWQPDKMDALLCLIPKNTAQEHRGMGDFFKDAQGRLTRRGSAQSAPYVYGGVQIIKTDGVAQISQKQFSLNLLWDEMLKNQRLFGIAHKGGWVDVGRPEGIVVAEAELNRNV